MFSRSYVNIFKNMLLKVHYTAPSRCWILANWMQQEPCIPATYGGNRKLGRSRCKKKYVNPHSVTHYFILKKRKRKKRMPQWNWEAFLESLEMRLSVVVFLIHISDMMNFFIKIKSNCYYMLTCHTFPSTAKCLFPSPSEVHFYLFLIFIHYLFVMSNHLSIHGQQKMQGKLSNVHMSG